MIKNFQVDVVVENHGSIFLFRLQTNAAREWVEEFVSDATWFAGAIAVEPRYARDLAHGMQDAGLEVR